MSEHSPLDGLKTAGKFGGGSVVLFLLTRLWTDVVEIRRDLRDLTQSVATVNTVAVSADRAANERKEGTAKAVEGIEKRLDSFDAKLDRILDRGRR